MTRCQEEALHVTTALAALHRWTAIQRSTDCSVPSLRRCRDAPSVQCSLPFQVHPFAFAHAACTEMDVQSARTPRKISSHCTRLKRHTGIVPMAQPPPKAYTPLRPARQATLYWGLPLGHESLMLRCHETSGFYRVGERTLLGSFGWISLPGIQSGAQHTRNICTGAAQSGDWPWRHTFCRTYAIFSTNLNIEGLFLT